jgi:hypothetical protein
MVWVSGKVSSGRILLLLCRQAHAKLSSRAQICDTERVQVLFILSRNIAHSQQPLFTISPDMLENPEWVHINLYTID